MVCFTGAELIVFAIATIGCDSFLALAHLALCACAILRREAADIIRVGCVFPQPSRNYLLTSRMPNVFGFIGGSSSPFGIADSKSAIGRKMLCVLKSIAIVRAYFFVGTFSTTVYLSAESW